MDKHNNSNVGHVYVAPDGSVFMSEGVTPKRVLPIDDAFAPSLSDKLRWLAVGIAWGVGLGAALSALVVLGMRITM